MSRAAVICTRGDPFWNLLQMKNFHNVWGDEIDTLYVSLNSPTLEKEVVDFEAQNIYCHHKIWFAGPEMSRNCQLNNSCGAWEGWIVKNHIKEDLVVMLEDDDFIFQKGAFDKCFSLIEDGTVDALGVPGGGMGPQIIKAMNDKYHRPSCRPNLLFAKVADMKKTDLDYRPKNYEIGKFYPELGITITEPYQSSDTGVWATIQLISQGLRFGDLFEYMTNDIRPGSPWTHTSTGSGVLYNKLFLTNNKPLGERKFNHDPWTQEQIDANVGGFINRHKDNLTYARMDEARIMSWTEIAYQTGRDEISKKIPDFVLEYGKALDRYYKISGTDLHQLAKFKAENLRRLPYV